MKARALTVPDRPAVATRPSSPKTLAMDALASLVSNSEQVSKLSRQVPFSATRHGDLQVIRSCALHIIESADVLIAEEQGGAA
jgi:hypothetical protein